MAYEARFTELARFALHIVSDEPTRTRKFLHRLRTDIQSKLAQFMLTQCADMVNCALVVEQYSETASKEQEKWKHPKSQGKKRNLERTNLKNPST